MKNSFRLATMTIVVLIFCFIAESHAHQLTFWEEVREEFRDVVSTHSDLPDTIVFYDNNGNMQVFVDARIAASRKTIQVEQEKPASPTPRGFASHMAQKLLKKTN